MSRRHLLAMLVLAAACAVVLATSTAVVGQTPASLRNPPLNDGQLSATTGDLDETTFPGVPVEAPTDQARRHVAIEGPPDQARRHVLTKAPSGRAQRDALVAGVTVAGAMGGQPSPYEAVDLCLRQEMEADGIPGGSVAIAIDGTVAWSRALGVKHLEQGGDVNVDTLFRIGSITKMMTAAAVMQLVEAGSLDLRAPITAYLPGFAISPPWGAELLAMHHLLTHTAGLPDRWGPTDGRTLQQWVADQAPVSLHAPPGSFYNYSNPGFILAGAIVERVSGTPFDDYLKRHVWNPAGMTLTTLSAEDVLADGNYATGHSGRARYAPSSGHSPFVGPAGLAFSTPTELVRWAQLLMTGGGTVLTPESVAAMTGEQVSIGTVPWAHYGYGVGVADWQRLEDPGARVRIMAHNGSYRGQRGILLWVPEQRFAVAALDNTRQADLGQTVLCALREVAGLEPIPSTGLTTAPSTWGRYAGTYAVVNRAAAVSTRHVELVGDALFTSIARNGPLYPPPAVTRMSQSYGDTFAFGGTGVTFVDDLEQPGTVRWMRNRGFVGMRAATFPRELTGTGPACAPLVLKAHMNLTRLAVDAYGLNAIERIDNEPIAQDGSGPAGARFKHDLAFRTDVPRLVVSLTGESDDNLDVFVLRDADGDGAFAYPAELVAQGTSRSARERVAAPGTLPAGSYQVWVHGVSVKGQASSFDLAIDAVHGRGLRVAGTPAKIRSDETVTLEVCPTAAPESSAPRYGVLLIDFGFRPRLIEVPLTWLPGPAVYLPTVTVQRAHHRAFGHY